MSDPFKKLPIYCNDELVGAVPYDQFVNNGQFSFRTIDENGEMNIHLEALSSRSYTIAYEDLPASRLPAEVLVALSTEHNINLFATKHDFLPDSYREQVTVRFHVVELGISAYQALFDLTTFDVNGMNVLIAKNPASEIMTGSINASSIAAGAITADKLSSFKWHTGGVIAGRAPKPFKLTTEAVEELREKHQSKIQEILDASKRDMEKRKQEAEDTRKRLLSEAKERIEERKFKEEQEKTAALDQILSDLEERETPTASDSFFKRLFSRGSINSKR